MLEPAAYGVSRVGAGLLTGDTDSVLQAVIANRATRNRIEFFKAVPLFQLVNVAAFRRTGALP